MHFSRFISTCNICDMYNRPAFGLHFDTGLILWFFKVVLSACYFFYVTLTITICIHPLRIIRTWYFAPFIMLLTLLLFFFFIQHVSKQWSSWLYLNGLLANGSNWKMFFCCYLMRHGDSYGVHVFFSECTSSSDIFRECLLIFKLWLRHRPSQAPSLTPFTPPP